MIEGQINKPKRIFGLDTLRVLSIFLVLFSHSSVIGPVKNGILPKLMDLSGFFGIEIFFGLSGFLIGSSIYKLFVHGEYRFKDAKDFILRRLLRILPSYYLVLLINVLIYFYFAFSLKDVWKYFFLIQNVNMSIPVFFPESWSLPVKELGYVWTLILLYLGAILFSKLNKKPMFYCVIMLLVLFSLGAKMVYNYNSVNHDLSIWSQSVRSVVIYRLDSVLFGLLFGCLYLEFPHFFKKSKLVFATLGILCFSFFIFCITFLKFRLDNAPWFWNVICLPFASLQVLMFFPLFLEWEKGPKFLRKPIKFICEVSYSVYLIHYSVILFLMLRFVDLKKYSTTELNVFTLVYLMVTFLLSYLLYTYFEKPINQYRLSNYKL